jgi:hypothetical protein
MLPSHLSSSFKRYKNDTDYFITWLAQTAVGCVFKLNHGPTPSPPAVAKGPRLKGKARKIARGQEAAHTTQTSLDKRKALTTKQLVDCAKRIAEKKAPSLQVPRAVYESLTKALQLRVECTSWFGKQEECLEDEEMRHINEAHDFFNSTLETIWQMILPLVEPTSSLRTPLPSKMAASANLYETLKQCSLSDDDEHGAPQATATKSSKGPVNKPAAALYEADKPGDSSMASRLF